MTAYEKFARVYDQMGSDKFSTRMFAYTQQILAQMKYQPKSVLDLACGTGTAAMMWAINNVVTFGIDGSAPMLAVARRKARKKKARIRFTRQPLTSFCLPRPVDLITCYYDSLNYLLSPKDLIACFRSAHQTLHPGGYFIFDVNTIEAMKVIWGSQVYGGETPDLAWIWRNCYFPRSKTAELKATFFERKGTKWERFDELHVERGYTPTEIRQALQTAGFGQVRVYECFTFKKPERKSLRIAVIARQGDGIGRP